MKKFKKLKIGVIGCGYWSTNLIKTLEDYGFKDISIFDNSKDQIKSIKKKFPYLKDYKKLDEIVGLKLDAVFLITPSSTHYKLSKKILNAGHNLFLEKPGTLKYDHIKDLSLRADKNNSVFMIGYIYNFNNYIKYIKNLLKKNYLGKIKYLYFERSNLGPIRYDTSCIWDLASHDVSTSYYLLDKLPQIENISGNNFLKKKYFDISYIKLNFSGIKVEIKSSWLNPEKIRKLVIIGEKRMLQFDELSKKNKILIYNKYATYPKISKFNKNFFSPHANIYLGRTMRPKIKFVSPMVNELQHFFSCLRKNINPKTDGSYAQKIVKILEKIDKLKTI